MESKREGRTDSPKEMNDIRIGMNSRVRNVIRYCNFVLNEKKLGDLRFSAVGGAIGKLVDAVEVLKIVNPGLYQVNKLATVSYQTVDVQGKTVNQRLYPKLEVTLTITEPKEKTEGTQSKLDEEERKKLFELLNSRQERRERRDGERPRGRGRPRGSFRGRGRPRGNFRGRGFRGAPRNGPRGAPRGTFRGGPRGRGVPRGNQRY